MRTTLILDEEMISKASALAGVKEKTALVHMGLEALIAKMSAARLARLGGSEKNAKRCRGAVLPECCWLIRRSGSTICGRARSG